MHEGNYSCSVPDYINTPVRIHIIEGKIGKYLPKCKNIVKLQKCFQDSLVCRTSEHVGLLYQNPFCKIGIPLVEKLFIETHLLSQKDYSLGFIWK